MSLTSEVRAHDRMVAERRLDRLSDHLLFCGSELAAIAASRAREIRTMDPSNPMDREDISNRVHAQIEDYQKAIDELKDQYPEYAR